MMENHKISVIVPIYKVELYIYQCINSIINQTYQNLEIILVDDGSPDNCNKICDEYALRDRRVRVKHTKNQGLAQARNEGLDICTGEFITFIDSDDWVKNDMIESLYKELINNNADISCCGFNTCFKNRNIVKKETSFSIFNAEQALKECILGKKITVSSWGKLYKKEIFDNIKYPKNKIYEDGFVVVEVFSKAKVVTINESPRYYYRKRKSSITNCSGFEKRDLLFIEVYIHILKKVSILYRDIDFINLCKIKVYEACITTINKLMFFEDYKRDDEYNKIKKKLLKNFSFIIKSKYSSNYLKCGIIMLKIAPVFLKWFFYLNLKRKKHKNLIENLFE